MLSKRLNTRTVLLLFATAVASIAFLAAGCVTEGPDAGTKSTSAGSPGTSATSPVPPVPSATLEAREPDSYTMTETIMIQPTGNSPQANIPQLQFSFSRMGPDRRVSFTLPQPVGEVIYLEKSPMKYLIFPARNEYVELDPQELGFQIGDVMSPVSAVERLKAKAPYEMLGTDTVNGRTAIKYRFHGATDTHTSAGTAQADSILYVDQDTGLPLRSEIEATSTSGAGAKIVTSTDSLQLIPASGMFDVPTTMKKVSSTEVKQQVQSFVSGVRVFADYLRQQATTAPPPPPPPAR